MQIKIWKQIWNQHKMLNIFHAKFSIFLWLIPESGSLSVYPGLQIYGKLVKSYVFINFPIGELNSVGRFQKGFVG